MRSGCMKKYLRKWSWLSLFTLFLIACAPLDLEIEKSTTDERASEATEEITTVTKGENYDTAQEVVDYLDAYDELPPNYLTKQEARELGWEAREGNLWEVAPGKSIGGDYFGNFEELLPKESGREYHEADIEYEGGRRNAKRLIYSNDDLYFYTEDHYESFKELKPGGENK